MELQKSANQGRRCTWEKLSAIKANCGIELALDECVAILNHMRRLKRSAERALAAASSHSIPLPTTVRFSASKRIPSWNVIARENSTGSLEEDLLAEAASSLHQGGVGASTPKNLHSHHRYVYDGSDSESETADLNSWTRSGGPLMRTTSANQFVDYVQNLEIDTRTSRGIIGHPRGLRVVTPDSTPEEADFENFGSRSPTSAGSSSIVVAEGDLLQPERILNGIVFNVVRKEVLTPSARSQDSPSEQNSSTHDSAAECVQLECPEKEMDTTSVSESGEDAREDVFIGRDGPEQVRENTSGDDVCDKHVTGG